MTTPTTVGGTISVPGFDFSITALGSSEVMSAAMSLTTPQPASNFNGTGSVATVAREFSVTASGKGKWGQIYFWFRASSYRPRHVPLRLAKGD